MYKVLGSCRATSSEIRGFSAWNVGCAGIPSWHRSCVELGAVVCRVPVDSQADANEGDQMSVAKVSEISATSSKSFEDALRQGIARANKTLRNVRSAWVKEQQVRVSDGAITEYQVNMMVTFVIDD